MPKIPGRLRNSLKGNSGIFGYGLTCMSAVSTLIFCAGIFMSARIRSTTTWLSVDAGV